MQSPVELAMRLLREREGGVGMAMGSGSPLAQPASTATYSPFAAPAGPSSAALAAMSSGGSVGGPGGVGGTGSSRGVGGGSSLTPGGGVRAAPPRNMDGGGAAASSSESTATKWPSSQWPSTPDSSAAGGGSPGGSGGSPASGAGATIGARSEHYQKERTKKLKQLKREHMNEEDRNMTFKPKLNRNFKGHIRREAADIGTRSTIQMSRRQRNAEQRAREADAKNTFSPEILSYSRQLSREEPVHHRLYACHKRQKDAAAEAADHQAKYDKDTGKAFFTPQINRPKPQLHHGDLGVNGGALGGGHGRDSTSLLFTGTEAAEGGGVQGEFAGTGSPATPTSGSVSASVRSGHSPSGKSLAYHGAPIHNLPVGQRLDADAKARWQRAADKKERLAGEEQQARESKKMSARSAVLARRKVERELQAAFDVINQSGSGVLSVDELGDALLEMGLLDWDGAEGGSVVGDLSEDRGDAGSLQSGSGLPSAPFISNTRRNTVIGQDSTFQQSNWSRRGGRGRGGNAGSPKPNPLPPAIDPAATLEEAMRLVNQETACAGEEGEVGGAGESRARTAEHELLWEVMDPDNVGYVDLLTFINVTMAALNGALPAPRGSAGTLPRYAAAFARQCLEVVRSGVDGNTSSTTSSSAVGGAAGKRVNKLRFTSSGKRVEAYQSPDERECTFAPSLSSVSRALDKRRADAWLDLANQTGLLSTQSDSPDPQGPQGSSAAVEYGEEEGGMMEGGASGAFPEGGAGERERKAPLQRHELMEIKHKLSNRRIEDERKKKDEAVMEKCTFSPSVKKSQRAVDGTAYGANVHDKLYYSRNRLTPRERRAIQAGDRRTTAEKEYDTHCTFTPECHRLPPNHPRVGMGAGGVRESEEMKAPSSGSPLMSGSMGEPPPPPPAVRDEDVGGFDKHKERVRRGLADKMERKAEFDQLGQAKPEDYERSLRMLEKVSMGA